MCNFVEISAAGKEVYCACAVIHSWRAKRHAMRSPNRLFIDIESAAVDSNSNAAAPCILAHYRYAMTRRNANHPAEEKAAKWDP